jgi:lysophospholipase L1-like esterase
MKIASLSRSLRIWLAGLLIAFPTFVAAQEPPKSPERWENEIRKFEEHDSVNSPHPGGVLFTGSSSIRMWDLKESFPDLEAVNRGFGGCYLSDVAHFADRVVLPHKPRLVIVYAGDNDIAAGKAPEQVVEAYQQLIHTIHTALPQTRIAFISIKPSLARWKLVEKMRATNGAIAAIAAADPRLDYIDIDAPMLGPDQLPRPELFRDDGLHLSPAGYQLWAERVLPVIERSVR